MPLDQATSRLPLHSCSYVSPAEVDKSHVTGLWLYVLTVATLGLTLTRADWHQTHASMEHLCYQRAHKSGTMTSALDPGQVERYTLSLVVLGARTHPKAELDPALKHCHRMSQALADLRLLRAAVRALCIGGQVENLADVELSSLTDAMCQVKRLTLLGWGIPEEYRRDRRRSLMHLAASHDTDDGPVMDASAALNAASACALFSAILGVCALAGAEDVGELPSELLRMEGAWGYQYADIFDTDLLEPETISDVGALRMVPIMVIKCLDWLEGVSVR